MPSKTAHHNSAKTSVDSSSALDSTSKQADAEKTPVAPVVPAADHTGPTFGGVGAGCGVNTILSVSVTDPSGVAAVWGSYYNDAGVKIGFTMSPSINLRDDYWTATIFDANNNGFDGSKALRKAVRDVLGERPR